MMVNDITALIINTHFSPEIFGAAKFVKQDINAMETLKSHVIKANMDLQENAIIAIYNNMDILNLEYESVKIVPMVTLSTEKPVLYAKRVIKDNRVSVTNVIITNTVFSPRVYGPVGTVIQGILVMEKTEFFAKKVITVKMEYVKNAKNISTVLKSEIYGTVESVKPVIYAMEKTK